jgi:hypothetical protein
MKRCVLALIPMVLVLGLGPAMAQPVIHVLAEREARLSERIDAGLKKGVLSEDQAARLRDRLRKIRKLEAYYRSTHGFSAWERRDVERRLSALGARLDARERSAHHS